MAAKKTDKKEKVSKEVESAETASAGTVEKVTPRLKTQYNDVVRKKLQEEFKFESTMQIPKIEKIVISSCTSDAISNSKVIDNVRTELAAITGQAPVVTRAKKSIATFKLREGMPIGCMVTLRNNKMWEFLDRLVNISLPRVRDFRGVNPNSFDGRGNYTLGLKEQIIFPEIDYDKVDKIRGMNIVIVTSAKNNEEARSLLTHMGMPFRK